MCACAMLVLACFAAACKLASNLCCDRVTYFFYIYLLIVFFINLLGHGARLYHIHSNTIYLYHFPISMVTFTSFMEHGLFRLSLDR